MTAAVYRGANDVRVEHVPVPEIGPGELLLRVHTCGVCGTDLKKIATGSHSAPRIFGHETAGTIAAVGDGVSNFRAGERVIVFHHIPCGHCYYCRHKTFAQCPVYKKVGATAGFEPSGGGFAEYVRVMDWIVNPGGGAPGSPAPGVIKIPENVSFEQASWVEPANTCLKAVENLRLVPDETVLVIGQGPIGILLSTLALRKRVRVITSDLFAPRLRIGKTFGLQDSVDASVSPAAVLEYVRSATEGRGADAVILAVGGNAMIAPAMEAARPGGRVMLFAQTQHSQAQFDPAAVCVDEKTLMGSYSASIDLQQQTADLVFSGEIPLERLITHRFPLSRAVEALDLAAHPKPDSMKVVIQPGK
jgi:L-iditol 2-dehydrogenase